jgi:putative peptidoglycan binding protein
MASDPGNSDGNKPAGGGNPAAPKPAAPGQGDAAPGGAAPGGAAAGGAHPVRGPFLIISPSSLPQNAQPKPAQPAQATPAPASSPTPAPAPAPAPAFDDDEPTLLADDDPALHGEEPPAEEPPERLVDIDTGVSAEPAPAGPPPQAAAQPEKPATQRAPQTPLSAGVADRLAALNNPPPRRGWGGCLTVLLVIAILAGGGYFLWRAGKLDPVLAWAKPYTDPVMEKVRPLIDKIEALIPGHQAAAPVTSDEAMIIETKQLLQKLDFNPGPIDGTLDPATVAAIQAYQEMAGEYVDGQPSEALLEELRVVANPKPN